MIRIVVFLVLLSGIATAQPLPLLNSQFQQVPIETLAQELASLPVYATIVPPPLRGQGAFTASTASAAVNSGLSLASTDHEMSRGLEDLVAVLLTKGTILKTDLSADLLSKIDARRALRGQATL
jgi:hypothetical protein